MVLKTSSSQEEGCERDWSILTKRFISNDGVNLSAIEIVKVAWAQDEEGKYAMKEIKDSTEIIGCDLVFLAIGFLGPVQDGMLAKQGIELDERGNVETNKFKTSVDMIFSAGDMHRGQSLVVWAIAEGRECADEVEQFLSSRTSTHF